MEHTSTCGAPSASELAVRATAETSSEEGCRAVLDSWTPRGRHAVAARLLAVGLIIFTLLRCVLLIRAGENIDVTLAETSRLLLVGALYDAGFLIHVALAFSVVALLPNRLFSLRSTRIALTGALAAVVFALLFEVVAEWYFWEEFGTRFNFISVDYLVYRREVTDNIRESYPLSTILPVIAIAALVATYALQRRGWQTLAQPLSMGTRLLAVAIVGLASAASGLFLDQGPRQSFRNNYVQELASNGPYQFVSAFRANELDFARFYALGDVDELTTVLRQGTVLPGETLVDAGEPFSIVRDVVAKQPSTKLNVMLVCVESLSASFMGQFGAQESVTPFLDSLAEESLLFTQCYATGTRTTRGLEALTLSLPPTPGRSIVKRPDCDRYASVGKVLEGEGYDRAFLYGGRGYFDNMNAFFSGNGYRVVDQTDLGPQETTFENAWGVCDEDLYQRALREADTCVETGRPFYFHLMTTSNHRPYTYPGSRVPIPSGTCRDGAVQYTDFALSRLFEAARQHDWFDDTLFVVVADHCASSAGRVGLPVEKYHIPLLVYSPKHVNPGRVDALCSQVDVGPTVLAMLGVSYTSRFFGQNVLDPGFQGRAFIGNYQKLGFLDSSGLAILSPQSRIEIMDCPFDGESIRLGGPEEALVRRAQAAYQAADYVIRNRVNRW